MSDTQVIAATGGEVIRQIREETDTVLLAFSCGKDSIAAWLAIRDHFKVIPFFKYIVRGLEFEERSLAYYEQFFGTPIIRVPHDSTFRLLRNFVFQAPENCAIIEQAELPRFGRDDSRDLAAKRAGLPAGTWTAIGTRAADSIQRRTSFLKFGAVNKKSRTFHPVWDMNKDGLCDTLRRAGVKLPAEYRIFGRSFDGLDFRFLFGVQKHFPRDYQRILDAFPLARLEIMRYEISQRIARRRSGQGGAAAGPAGGD